MSGFFSRLSDAFQQIGESVQSQLGGEIGNDVERGTPNHDRVFGGLGDDRIESLGFGNDLAVGGQGDDTITGGIGTDVLAGGLGDDRLFSTEPGAGGGATLMFGDDGRDEVIAGPGDNLMFGGGGDDSLWGGAGYIEVASGGDGNDVMNTGPGVGVMIGGAGSDTFAFGSEAAVNGRQDVVVTLDFQYGTDHLFLDPAMALRITSVQDMAICYQGVLDCLRAEGVFGGDVAGKVADAGEAPLADQLAVMLAPERASGLAVVHGAAAMDTDGDILFFAGLSAAQLDQLI